MTQEAGLSTPGVGVGVEGTTRRSRWLEGKWNTWLVMAVAAVVLTLVLFDRLADPPLWDAVWTTSAGAAELSRNGFDYAALLAAPPFDEGGPGTHASSLLTPLLGLFFVLFGSPGGLVAGHILMIGVGSALVASTFALGKRYLPPWVALAVAGAVVSLPLIVQQVADPYVDLPLALCTVLTVIAFLDVNRVRAAAFAALAVWFKPTGLMLLPLVALMGSHGETQRWLKNGMASLVAVAPFSIVLMGQNMGTHAGATPTLDGTLTLMRNAFWILGATTDVLVILFLFFIGASRQRGKQRELVKATGIVTLSFFAFHVLTMMLSQVVTILPRYYIAVVPLWLVVVAVYLVDAHSQKAASALLIGLILFSVVNWNGTFYPLADHPQAPMAERTPGGGREYLQMEMAGTTALVEAADEVDLLVLDNAVNFRVRYPELGFVDEVPDNIVLGLTGQEELPNSFAWLQEPHISPSATPAEIAAERGLNLERTTIWDGRWQSDLVRAAQP